MSLAPNHAPPSPAEGWRRFRAQPRRWIIAEGAALLVLAAVALLWSSGWRFWQRENPLLITPELALARLETKSLYYNNAAWRELKRWRPDLLTPADRDPESDRLRSFSQAVQSPKLFRQLDRQYRFDALLFVGDPSQYRPLLDHLRETGDWGVTYVDHTSIVWKRGATSKWALEQLAPVRAAFAGAPSRDRATFLALTASKLIALQNPTAARALLDEARQTDTHAAEVESAWAQYFLARGEWKEAEAAADRALQLDPASLAALGAKAQALYSTKRFAEAYALSKRLTERIPDDPSLLFYHAKIAHEARAFEEETRVLRRLILLAEAGDRPIATYRVYLGQALASNGEGPAAITEFERAIADPECPPEQRKFARECVAHVRSQVGG